MRAFVDDKGDLGVVNSASKIWEKIKNLRNLDDREKDKYSRRWVWELLQNAKDVSNEKVNIKIEYNDNKVVFSHDGRIFTCKDLLSLVTQTSFKEIENNETTGKFGTGFITTHLLSEKIDIVGAIKDYNGNMKELKFSLDRSGKTRAEIQDLVQQQMQLIETIDDSKIIISDLPSNLEYTTNFIYETNDSVDNIIFCGLLELENSLPYVLSFVPQINSIFVNDMKKIFKISKAEKLQGNYIKVNFTNVQYSLIVVYEDDISIAIPISSNSEKHITDFPEKIPKIFCGFPLIGTETFPISLVINSRNFDVTEPRDGIMLGSNNNKELLKKITMLYQKMLITLAEEGYDNLYCICKIGNSDDSWVQNEILDTLKNIYRRVPIINTTNGTLDCIEDNNGNVNIRFPYDNENKVKELFWELCNEINLVNKIPTKSDMLNWISVIKEEKYRLTIDNILTWIETYNELAKLNDVLKRDVNVIEWFNKLYFILDQKNQLNNELLKRKIVPNQNGVLFLDRALKKDNNISDELKDILENLGENIRSSLRDPSIIFPGEENKDELSDVDIASKIKNKVYSVLHEENSNNSTRNDKTKKAFKQLILWFGNNSSEAIKIFDDLYERKYKLYDDNEIIENIKMSQEITKIMKDYSITDINEIRRIIESSHSKESITDVNLASFGITNMNEFDLLVENEEIKRLFTYESKPSYESLNYVQSIIQRSKLNVLNYLKNYPDEYDCSDYQETANTILAGIKKYNRPIKLVVRPSDGDKIIIHSESELDTMDYVEYELWVDNNRNDPQRITFGKLLKLTGVKVIPLRKLFY